ncbi:MAG: family 20 glycosylhydrolase [Planctomycetota bacterium]
MKSIDLAGADEKHQFYVLPHPRSIRLRGAPFRLSPSNFLYVSANASSAMRRKCFVFCQQMLEAGFRATLTTTLGLGPTQALFTPAGSFQKPPNLDRPLHGEVSKPSGYRLSITSEGALLHGADEQGLQYAGVTLCQLLQDSQNIPGMEIEDYPLLPWRVLHLDFKGWPPIPSYLKQVISTLGAMKINGLVLEYESFFNFPSQPGLASPGALTAEQMTEIELYAQDLGVTLIPLIPCLGNVGYVLRHSAYKDLREHPQFLQQYCPVNPATLNLVTAMMEDLLAIHPGKYFHIGGDEARLLGANPVSNQRAQQLGGRAVLYLEYIGKVCRYLLSRNRYPLIWDDMLRNMTDEQIQWLPPEATLTFWQYEGYGGRATKNILTTLDRYHKLGRSVWGAATRTPSVRYESFDNIDAWSEAAELGYLNGLITTAWTRDYTLGPLFPPPETAWPGAFYSAERMWSGHKCLSRESFPKSFIIRMFGVKDATLQSHLWAGFDLLLREYPRHARDFFAQDFKHVLSNRDTLSFLEIWAALGAFKEYVQQFDEATSSNYANLQAGQGDPLQSGRLRWRIADVKSKAPALARAFIQRAARITPAAVTQEYLDSMVAFNLKRLDNMESLLSSYPLPDPEWQQPVQLQ